MVFLLPIKVIPQSSQESIIGWVGDALKIKVRAKPEDGKANQALRCLLSKTLKLPLKAITLKHGFTSREKLFAIESPNDTYVLNYLPPKQQELFDYR